VLALWLLGWGRVPPPGLKPSGFLRPYCEEPDGATLSARPWLSED
jgi:hypothetical protein